MPFEPEPPDDAPSPDALQSVFRVYEIRENEDGRVFYFGDPVASRERLVETLWPLFDDEGYDVSLTRRNREYILVAKPETDGGFPWLNLVLFVLTILSTLYAGSAWYYVFYKHDLGTNPWGLVDALPFVVAVLGVLGTHELGHYLMSKYHDVDASLPYFIPMTPPIGTMGAVIRMRGQIPDRKALFDIGVAGPIAGLVASVIVTAVGLTLPPVTVPAAVLQSPTAITVEFGYPPLLQFIAAILGEPLRYSDPTTVVNPVVIGGWVGMFVTFLNLLPVGQLDGGHIVRAILGSRQPLVAAFVPAALFGLAGYLHYVRNVGTATGIWVLWGLLTTILAYSGPASTVSDAGIGRTRTAVGVLTLLVGLFCFTPVPIDVAA